MPFTHLAVIVFIKFRKELGQVGVGFFAASGCEQRTKFRFVNRASAVGIGEVKCLLPRHLVQGIVVGVILQPRLVCARCGATSVVDPRLAIWRIRGQRLA